MKFSAALALIVFVGLVANSSALPAKKRMVYLAQQQPQWYGAPQRMMYVQYVQPSHTHARSTQAAEALVAGESVATGTYLNDCDHSEADIHVAGPAGSDALGAADGVQAVAQAYPEDNEVDQEVAVDAQVAGDVALNVATDVAVDVDVATAVDVAAGGDSAVEGAAVEDAAVEGAVVEGAAVGGAPAVVEAAADEGAVVELEVESTDAKVPRDYKFETETETEVETAEAEVEVAAEEPAAVPAAPAVVDVAAELPPPAPIAPVAPVVPVAKPARRYLPASKKVYVELEQSSDADEAEVQDDDEDEDEVVAAPVNPVRVPNARRPSKKAAQSAGAAKPTKAPLPAGSFFPIDFGGTNGGAIAIANSFSTGEGGSATSHAIAYGSPDAARTRSRPSKIH